jgi:flagellar biosynthesis/type III secretory pathway chaperone
MQTDLLANLMDRKHEVLVQLHQLSQQQRARVDEGHDVSELLGLLAAKQTLLDKLNTLERQLDPFRRQDPESRDWRSADERRRCSRVAGRCQSLMGEILELERHAEMELRRRRDRTAERLKAVSNGAAARAAYAAAAPPPPTVCDLSAEA